MTADLRGEIVASGKKISSARLVLFGVTSAKYIVGDDNERGE